MLDVEALAKGNGLLAVRSNSSAGAALTRWTSERCSRCRTGIRPELREAHAVRRFLPHRWHASLELLELLELLGTSRRTLR